jgi:acetyl-CoA C-acetyltransferase
MTKVAASNPYAWFPVERTADEVATPTAENRLVADPYTKLLMSVMDVDLAAAVVLASHATAEGLGVPPADRVYLRGWCYATDPVYVAEHDALWCSPAMAASTAHALRTAGIGVDEVAHIDLYSCFPSSVSFALDALGLATTDSRAPFTVTGGLPYFGGVGSCYLTHAIASMADVLRADPGSNGLITGVGMHMTKHVAAVWSTTPPVGAPPTPDEPAVQARLDIENPRRAIVDVHHGAATIAACTVHHGRDGEPTDGLVVCDIGADPSPARCYAVVRDPAVLESMGSEEWVGRTVELVAAGGSSADGVNLVDA